MLKQFKVILIKEIFGITGGWLISLFALFLSIIFVFNISIKDILLNNSIKIEIKGEINE